MRHLVSFLKSPLGYLLNLLATLLVYAERLPIIGANTPKLDKHLIPLLESFCIQDGIQDNPLF